MPQPENNSAATKGAGMSCYVAGVLMPIIYLSSEPYKRNSFLRFHSFQSIVFTLIWAALTITNDHIRFHVRSVNAVLSMLGFLFFVPGLC